jgi:hypothetical protein
MSIEDYKRLYDEAIDVSLQPCVTIGDERAALDRAIAAWKALTDVEAIYVWTPNWLWMMMGRKYRPPNYHDRCHEKV